MQYGDGANLYEASQTQSRTVAEEPFTAFSNRDPSWKTKVSFVAADGGAPPSDTVRPGVQSFSMEGVEIALGPAAQGGAVYGVALSIWRFARSFHRVSWLLVV